MKPKNNSYIKASQYDLGNQLHNHRVFIGQLRDKPFQAVVLALFFAALGLIVIILSSDASGHRPLLAWLLALISSSVAVYLLGATFLSHD